MGRINRIEDLDCWKKTRVIVRSVYSVSKEGPLAKDYSTRNQVRRAALSIMNNIAEGFSRPSSKEFIRFLSIAEPSAAEVKSMLYVFEDLNYLASKKVAELHLEMDDVRKQIRSFIST